MYASLGVRSWSGVDLEVLVMHGGSCCSAQQCEREFLQSGSGHKACLGEAVISEHKA